MAAKYFVTANTDGFNFVYGDDASPPHGTVQWCESFDDALDLMKDLNAVLDEHRGRRSPVRQDTRLRICAATGALGTITDPLENAHGISGWLVLASEGGLSLEINMHPGEYANDAAARFARMTSKTAVEILRSGDLRSVRSP